MHGLDERKEGIVPKNINDLVAKGSDLQRHRMVSSVALTIYYRQSKNINDLVAKGSDLNSSQQLILSEKGSTIYL